jgi:hypothetical protein
LLTTGIPLISLHAGTHAFTSIFVSLVPLFLNPSVSAEVPWDFSIIHGIVLADLGAKTTIPDLLLFSCIPFSLLQSSIIWIHFLI